MITAAIGKIFLDAYNEKYGTNYDAKTFFVEVYYPLFFNQEKYMMTAGNTPLENPKISWADMIAGKKHYETITQRRIRFDKFMLAVDIGFPTTDNSLGFASTDINAKTSGQTTNNVYPFTKDDVFYSWFGASLGIGLQNGISILFTEPAILMDLFDGWKLYRTVLNENDSLKGNQVNTWNGQWLAHRYDEGNFYTEQPMAGFSPFETTKDGMSVAIQSWTKILIGIALHYDRPKMMGYVYGLGKTNTTIGFIPFNLEHIRKPIQLYAQLFGAEEGKNTERLWGTEMGFRTCCQKGAIGIEAMQPKGLRQYMDGTKIPKKAKDENQSIIFKTYIIWILSMLNDQSLWDKSTGFAKVLLDYSKSGKSSKTDKSRKVDRVLAATNQKGFISALQEILNECKEREQREQIGELAKYVISMSKDDVPYFITILKFCYTLIN